MIRATLTVKSGSTMELIDITSMIGPELNKAGISDGILHIFNPHTTAGLTINEGADPAVRQDIISGLRQIVPLHHPFKHLEGNSPAHIMATLAGSSLTVAVVQGSLQLGTWQRIFFCEFDGPRTRNVHCYLLPG